MLMNKLMLMILVVNIKNIKHNKLMSDVDFVPIIKLAEPFKMAAWQKGSKWHVTYM